MKSTLAALFALAATTWAHAQNPVTHDSSTGAATAAGGAGMFNYVLIGGMLLFMWFVIINPQRKQQKERQNFVESLKEGDEIVTDSGLVGTIQKIEDSTMLIESHGTRLKVLKSTATRAFKAPAAKA